MPENLPTRRTILGATGAAALSSILLPWRPKPHDILVASEIPPAALKIENCLAQIRPTVW